MITNTRDQLKKLEEVDDPLETKRLAGEILNKGQNDTIARLPRWCHFEYLTFYKSFHSQCLFLKYVRQDLKDNVKLALDASLSIKKNGKQYYNTVKFHGNTAVEDIQLIQVFEDTNVCISSEPL